MDSGSVLNFGEGTLPVKPFWTTEEGIETAGEEEATPLVVVCACICTLQATEKKTMKRQARLRGHVVGMITEKSVELERHRTTTTTT